MSSLLQQIRLDRCGATAIEYAMIAVFISIAAVVAFASVGTSVTDAFQSVANSF